MIKIYDVKSLVALIAQKYLEWARSFTVISGALYVVSANNVTN